MLTPGKASDMTRALRHACKEGDYTNSTLFYMYFGAKYMRMPRFWKIPKMYNPLG